MPGSEQFIENVRLIPWGLLIKEYHKMDKKYNFIFHSAEGWKSQIRVPTWLADGCFKEQTSCILTWHKRLGVSLEFPQILSNIFITPISMSFSRPPHLYGCAVLYRFSRVPLFATLWTAARQAPLPMGFSRQEHWRGLPCPPPGDLPDPGTEPASLMSPALAGGFFTTSNTWEPSIVLVILQTI